MEESPNWLEMPHELMENILQRLDAVEILHSALEVCTTWWKICKDPAKWKVIDMRKPVDARYAHYDLVRLTKKAVNLSCGELIDISIEGFGTDNLLDHIVLRSSKLNSLCLTDCCSITHSRLSEALKRVSQLEKLHLTYTTSFVEYIKDVVPNCPQLKSFKLDKVCIRMGIENNDDAFAIAHNMPELRHLQVYGNNMTSIGLQAILGGCPHLESLDVCTSYSCYFGGIVGKQCMERIKSFKGPDDSTENCGFRPRIIAYVDSDDDYGYNFPSDKDGSDDEYYIYDPDDDPYRW